MVITSVIEWTEMEVLESFRTIFANVNVVSKYDTGDDNLSATTGSVRFDVAEYETLLEDFKLTLHTHGDPRTIVLICLYVPVFLVAFFGNLLVLLVVLPNRHMRSITNCFIVNLAAADLLVILVCVPMAVGQSVYKVWIYGRFMCKITGFLQGAAVAASVLTIMTLSIDRYLAIRHPMTFRKFSNGRHAWKIILAIWILSFVVMIPLLLVRKIQPLHLSPSESLPFCNEIWRQQVDRQIYDIFLFVFTFIMPGCVLASCYSRIGCQLWTEGKTFYRTDSKIGQQQAERLMVSRRRVARMLLVLAIFFALCWMPYHLTNVYADFDQKVHWKRVLESLPFTICLGHANSALNPVMYCFMNKSFRKYTARLLRCNEKKMRTAESPVNLVVCYSRMNGSIKTSVRFSRKPRIRVFSTTSTGSRSTSGSLRFSRSTNTSLRSSRSSNKSDSINKSPNQDTKILEIPKMFGHESEKNETGDYSTLTVHQESEEGSQKGRKRREIFNYSLNIPTTINEESSRLSRTPSPTFEKHPCMTPIFERYDCKEEKAETEKALASGGVANKTKEMECQGGDEKAVINNKSQQIFFYKGQIPTVIVD